MIKDMKEFCKEKGVDIVLAEIFNEVDKAKGQAEIVSVGMPDSTTAQKFGTLLQLVGYQTLTSGNYIAIKI